MVFYFHIFGGIMKNLLSILPYVVVQRGAREPGRGCIIMAFATYRAAIDYAKKASVGDNDNFYWAMPRNEY